MKNFILLTSIVLFFYGCSATQKVSTNEADQRIYDLTFNGIGIDVGTTRKETVELLGEPEKVEKTLVENSYYEFKDEITTYFYPGLEVLYFKHNHPEYGWDKVSKVEISGNNYDLKYGIKIGMSSSDVFRNFRVSECPSSKNEKTQEEYYFCIPVDAVTEQVIFVIKNKKLEKFIWSFLPE